MFLTALKQLQNRVLHLTSDSLFQKKILFKFKPVIQVARISKTPIDHNESIDAYVHRMECYFNRPDIDGWELRKGLNEIAGMDIIPDPQVLIAAMCACRRVNDYALTTRILEMTRNKCGPQAKSIYPYLLEHIEPCLCELGIETPESMGYDNPELYLVDVYDIH